MSATTSFTDAPSLSGCAGGSSRALAGAVGVLLALTATVAVAQERTAVPDVGQDRLALIGEIATRSSTQARAQGDLAIFSIGLETIERDYASYDQAAPWIDALGAGTARLMSGWHNIERERGVYDFSEIDFIVDDLRSKGVQPWVSLGYGNPAVYGPEAAAITLGSGLPRPGPAREAWLRFVDRTVRHLGRGRRVVEWDIWNEPDPRIPAEDYAAFAIETARVILAAQPKAVLNIGAFTPHSLTGPGTPGHDYVLTVVDRFAGAAVTDPWRVKVTLSPLFLEPGRDL